MVGFIRNFSETRENALKWMERVERLPAPLARVTKAGISRRQQTHHFGQPVPIEECEQILESKIMWLGEWVVQLDEQQCSSCGECALLCPFGAISAENGVVRAHVEDCWGCGICRSGCDFHALTIVDRRTVPEAASIW